MEKKNKYRVKLPSTKVCRRVIYTESMLKALDPSANDWLKSKSSNEKPVRAMADNIIVGMNKKRPGLNIQLYTK